MTNKPLSAIFTDRNLKGLAIIIIIVGIALRLIFFFQDRCLFIDEANVARNIYERSFSGLTMPLNYEQYAPPAFLWIIKSFALLFGYSELSLRLFLLLCGITALFLLYAALRKFADNYSIWYPLFIFATGFIYIRYSAELKQYMCDVIVTLLLLLLALRIDISRVRNIRFAVVWCVIGSATIWLSMPGVFMLAGVMAYYAYISVSEKKYTNLWQLTAIGCIWLIQFALYYLAILKPQIQSDYLQACHKDFFLFGIPSTLEKLNHNADVFVTLLSAMGGK